ncbi:hypothetical protein [Alysiella crassa]|uniref:hypothetical protein n=1 Tax=Alysiella crassa TaxID=153491 RepID=UPI0012EC8BF3|nr:hypothetical protein [Alysiella crassa]
MPLLQPCFFRLPEKLFVLILKIFLSIMLFGLMCFPVGESIGYQRWLLHGM